MGDLDRALHDALRFVNDEYVRSIERDVPAAQHQIRQKINTRRFAFAVGGVTVAAAAVAAVLFVGQETPRQEQRLPRPADSPSISTSPAPPPLVDCAAALPFEPSRPWSMGLGSGSQVGVPLDAQTEPRALVHYSRSADAHVDVVIDPSDEPRGLYEPVDVLGTSGRITPMSDGEAIVSFDYRGCGFHLVARGFEDASETARRFAEQLVPLGSGEAMGGFALWPETAPADAFAGCTLPEDYRTSPEAAATVFADQVLGWPDVQMRTTELVDEPNRRLSKMSIELVRPSTSVTAELTLYELARDCWSVISVRTPDPDGESYLSVGKRDGRLTVGLDLDHEPDGDAVERLRLVTWSGDGSERAETSVFRRSYERKREMGPGLEVEVPEGPTGFVLLLENADLEVIGAIGQPLPAGDFAAG